VKTITRFACAYYIKLLKLNRENHNRCIETKRNKRKKERKKVYRRAERKKSRVKRKKEKL
jgi:hypothetical protein